jgi:4-amino-4-deoxy-L-arabinose transferase-like glycosyltransferase
MFFLCRDVFGDNKAGLMGMAFAAFNPYSVRMASQILREPLYILLFTLSLWCAVRVIRGKGGNLLYPAGIGILTILGFYTRIEGFEIILFLPVALVILLVQYKKQYLKQCIYGLTVFALTVSVLFAALLYFKEDYMSRLNGRVISYYKLFTSERVNDL